MAFVGRSGSNLTLPSSSSPPSTFRFVSFNVPNLGYLEDNSVVGRTTPTPFEQEDALLSIAMLGGRVARTYVISVLEAFAPGATNFTVREQRHLAAVNSSEAAAGFLAQNPTWKRIPPLNATLASSTTASTVVVFANEPLMVALDNAIALAGKHDVRLIIPFIDNWAYWGGAKEFASYWAAPSSAFYTDVRIRDGFKSVLQYILARNNTVNGITYANDPTILGWETGNELQLANLGRLPAEWTSDIAKTLKALDPNHLVIDGSFGAVVGWDSAVLSDPNVDIFTGHYYGLPFNPGRLSPIVTLALLAVFFVIALLIVSIFPRWFPFLRDRPLRPPSDSENICLAPWDSPAPAVVAPGRVVKGRTVIRKQRWILSLVALAICLAVSVALFLIFGFRLLTTYEKSYADRMASDAALAASYGKAFFVGEFGIADTTAYNQVLDAAVADPSIAGVLMWSLRFHSRAGGFYTHAEDATHFAYHYPGFRPTNGTNATGFGVDEVAVMDTVASHAATVNAGTGYVAPLRSSVPTPAPVILNATSSVAAGLIWTGSAGASSYRVERSVDGGKTFAVAAEDAVDNVGFGRAIFVDGGAPAAAIGAGVVYKVTAKNANGESAPSAPAVARAFSSSPASRHQTEMIASLPTELAERVATHLHPTDLATLRSANRSVRVNWCFSTYAFAAASQTNAPVNPLRERWDHGAMRVAALLASPRPPNRACLRHFCHAVAGSPCASWGELMCQRHRDMMRGAVALLVRRRGVPGLWIDDALMPPLLAALGDHVLLADVVAALVRDNNIRVGSSKGWTDAMSVACEAGDVDTLAVIVSSGLACAGLHASAAFGLFMDADRGDMVVKLMACVKMESRELNNLLRDAAARGHEATVALLMARADVDPADGFQLAMRVAASNGHAGVVKLLLSDNRVDPSAVNGDAIKSATTNGYASVVECLLTDPRTEPWAALARFCTSKPMSTTGHSYILGLLLDRAAQDDNADDSGRFTNLLALAARYGKWDLVARLIRLPYFDPTSEGAQLVWDAIERGDDQGLAVLINDGRILLNTDNNRAIRTAAALGRADMVELLMSRACKDRVDPTVNESEPLRSACARGDARMARELLKDARVDPSARGHEALKLAAALGNVEIVKILMKDGRCGVKDGWAEEALLGALRGGHEDVIRLLLPAVDLKGGLLWKVVEGGHINALEALICDPRLGWSVTAEVRAWMLQLAKLSGQHEMVTALRQPDGFCRGQMVTC
ncbi:hypothetical protein HK101_002268 [Irineochytrium annulatum]|nr:hypothetical protein HK101_002268 [Irineochytrium annulatum]